MRSTSFTDPSYHLPSHNKACYQTPEAQSAKGTGPEDLMQKSHTHLRKDQSDEQIVRAMFRSFSIGIHDPSQKSFSVSEAVRRASEDQRGEPESDFDRLHAMPEDRQYILDKFLKEETHQLAGALNEGPQELSSTADKGGQSTKHPLPQGKKSRLDPRLLMMGAFADDFDEYEIDAHRKPVLSANHIHSTSTKHPIIKPEAIAKEYGAYESRFEKPHKKP